MDGEHNLTPVELQHLDVLISAAAQRRRRKVNDVVEKTPGRAEAMADVQEAMWEARHGEIAIVDRDRKVIARLQELAGTLERNPTLSRLIDLRAQALRGK